MAGKRRGKVANFGGKKAAPFKKGNKSGSRKKKNPKGRPY